ncbi:MAG: helix-hairpin-helix domain-containing protein [Candidatus Thorarchaeota archaeon]
MTLENKLKRKKENLKYFYQIAQEALDAKDLKQAIEITAKGLEEAEEQRESETLERFDEVNELNPSLVREDITVIKGVGVAVAKKLIDAGFFTIQSIAEASLPQLTTIQGIGQKIAQKILEGAKTYTSRKNLNDFPQEPYETNNRLLETARDKQCLASPRCDDKFKIKKKRTIISMEDSNKQDYLYEEDNDDPGPDYRVDNLIKEEEIITSKIILSSNLKHSHQTQSFTIQVDEELLPEEARKITENIINALRESGYHIIEKICHLKDLSKNSDLIAIKIIHANEFLDIIITIPIKFNILKGELKISNNRVSYIPLNDKFNGNGAAFRLVLDSTINDLGKIYSSMREDLTKQGKLLTYLEKYLQVGIILEKSVTGKNLFFRAGPLQYKIFIDPILISDNEVGFMEKVIPFPYIKDENLHIITCQKFPDFLAFLEKKYILLEEHTEQKNDIISYEDSFNQFLRIGKKISAPLIGFGIILLLLLSFQSFSILELVVNIGYVLFGIYMTVMGYLYYKFFKIKLEIQKDFETPHTHKQITINDSGLILIGEELSTEQMEQFIFECYGKTLTSPFLQKIEEIYTMKRLEENVKAAKVNSEKLFEDADERREDKKDIEEGSEEEIEIFEKYSSFLED